MRSIKLTDGTIIEGCTDNTTADNIEIVRATANEAAAYTSILNKDNTSSISVYDENGELVSWSHYLILSDFVTMTQEYDPEMHTTKNWTIHFTFSHKSELELLKDEIVELQEYIIEGGDL